MCRSFLYKAIINRETNDSLARWFKLHRQLYNIALEQRISAYRKQRKSLSLFDQGYELKGWAKDFPEYSGINVQSLHLTLKRLDKAYQGFFSRCKRGGIKAGFPRFKGTNRFDSIQLSQSGWKLEGRNLYVSGLGRFKLFLDRPVLGKIKIITIRKASSGKIFVSFSCKGVPTRVPSETDMGSVGIDVGLSNFATDSDGVVWDNPRYYRAAEARLAKANQNLSRKKKGSNHRNKAKQRIALLHEKIANQRNDYLHKVSRWYVNNYSVICLENLNISGMLKNRHLAKSIADAGWGRFGEFISYKAEEAGRKAILIPPHFTSQLCSSCGTLVRKSLSTRTHCCPECGLVLDRDENAAINIKQIGCERLRDE